MFLNANKFLKNEYNINTNLIIYDINSLENNEYEFKIYSLEGNELDINYCLNEGISFCTAGYYNKIIDDKNECVECPEECLTCSEESIQNNQCIKCNTITLYSLSENKKCTKKCEPEDFFNKICKIQNNNPEVVNDMINNIKKSLLGGPLNSLVSDDFSGLVINENNIIYSITREKEQDINNNGNISIVQLNECETILRDIYNIDKNDSLIIFKLDVFEEGLLIPIVEYEIYDIKNKRKLDLNYCNNTSIYILLSVSINENELFKHNISSKFYNDICFPYTTINKTDIIIKDRRDEFIKQNLSLCEKNCEFQGYNSSAKRAICNCKAKTKMKQILEIKNDKEKLLNNFAKFETLTNIGVIKCYKLLSKKEYIKYNLGFYLLLFIILFYLILLLYFLIKGFNILIDRIKIILNREINEESKYKIVKTNPPKMIINDKKKSKFIDRSKNSMNLLNTIGENNNSMIKSTSRKEIKNQDIIKIKTDEIDDDANKKILKYNDYEINTLDYNEAIILDKRKYLIYYFSLLKAKHLIIFTFYTKNDYNSKTIKICLFLFLFSLYITINALFFNDSTMHKIYIEQGKYNLAYQIPQIVYSLIISNIINTIIKYLSLTEIDIVNSKKKKKKLEYF